MLTLASRYSFYPLQCLCKKLSLSPLYFNKTLLHTHTHKPTKPHEWDFEHLSAYGEVFIWPEPSHHSCVKYWERFSPKSNLRVLTCSFFCWVFSFQDSHLSLHLSLALTLAIAQAQIFCCLLGILVPLLKPIPNRLHQEGSCSKYIMVYKAKNLTNNLYFLSLSP